MTDYLKNILDDLPRKYQGGSITPAADHLFEVDNTTRKLSKGYTQAFHMIVTKLLFLCNLERPNILTGVAFITTRVKETDEDEDKKIGRILKYISGTRDLVHTLVSDGTGTIKWWVDAAFAVNHDNKSHTGGMVSMLW